jgi:hypothetical protein
MDNRHFPSRRRIDKKDSYAYMFAQSMLIFGSYLKSKTSITGHILPSVCAYIHVFTLYDTSNICMRVRVECAISCVPIHLHARTYTWFFTHTPMYVCINVCMYVYMCAHLSTIRIIVYSAYPRRSVQLQHPTSCMHV